jgi:hypothetical protein
LKFCHYGRNYLWQLNLRIVTHLLRPNFGLLVFLIVQLHILAHSHFLKNFLPQKVAHWNVCGHFFLEVQKDAQVFQKAGKHFDVNALGVFVVDFFEDLEHRLFGPFQIFFFTESQKVNLCHISLFLKVIFFDNLSACVLGKDLLDKVHIFPEYDSDGLCIPLLLLVKCHIFVKVSFVILLRILEELLIEFIFFKHHFNFNILFMPHHSLLNATLL